jgi:MFS family permease
MMAALFFGLVPTILAVVFDRHSPLESGVTAFIVPAISTLCGVLLAKGAPHRLMLLGGVAVLAAATLVITSTAFAILPLLWVGGVAGGIAFGSTLTGTIRSLIPQVQPHETAELFAAIYTVAYLAFGVPAIVAGLFVSSAGVTHVAMTFGFATALVGALGLAGSVLLNREITELEVTEGADLDVEASDELAEINELSKGK